MGGAEDVLIFRSGTNEKPDEFGVRQYRIPHVTHGPEGQLIVSVAGRTHQAGDNGHTTSVFATSEDGGKTWTPIRFESDYSKPTPKGHFPMCSRTNEIQVEWMPSLNCWVAIYTHKYKCYQIRSKDLKTWGEPMLIPHQEELTKSWPSPTSMHVEEDGTLCFGLIAENAAKHRSVKLYWTEDCESFEASELGPYSHGESSIVSIGDGEYLIASRSRKGKVKGRVLFTYNRATKAWGELKMLPVYSWYSCEQDMVSVGNTIYLSVPAGNNRNKGRIYASDDKGQNWRVHYELPKEDYFGYSALVALDGGGLGLVYEKKPTPDKLLNIYFRKIPTGDES